MNNRVINKSFVICLAAILLVFANVSAQTQKEETKRVNFRYSQNPKTNSGTADKNSSAQIKETNTSVTASPNSIEKENRSIATKTLEIAKRASKTAMSPTEIYKIGQGDILFISLQNAPSDKTNYFTVLSDGSIDYPLAGELVLVEGLITEEVEDLLREKIKLYKNPQVAVKVREFASHSYTVLGSVENAGEKFLQREAIPLYVIKAEAVVKSNAAAAIIKRLNAETETVVLADQKSDDILIFPGDIIEFKPGVNPVIAQTSQFYFIGGNINSVGQKEFHQGLTLTQAVLASGGLRKSGVKTVVIRRKNQDGLLASLEFDLNSIKKGKQVDPILQAGDTIEIVD